MYNGVWGKAPELPEAVKFSRILVLKATLQSVRLLLTVSYGNKTADLSQRRTRDAPNIWVPRKISRVLISKRLLFPKFVTDFCSDRY